MVGAGQVFAGWDATVLSIIAQIDTTSPDPAIAIGYAPGHTLW